MSIEISRRQWLAWATATAGLAGCDRLNVEVSPKPGGFATDNGIRSITPNEGFYVYEHQLPPVFDQENWSLSITTGLGMPLAALNRADLAGFTPIQLEHTLQCVGGNPRNTLISNAIWGGLPFDEILAMLGVEVPAGTVEIVFQGHDSYETAVPISDLLDGQLWLVWQMNGEPLPFRHGAPCRFLAIGRYGTKNVKWPQRLWFSEVPYDGYWEVRGWDRDAVYRVNAFVFNPLDGTSHTDNVVIFGTSYAGEDPVERVEITFDDGQTWADCELDYAPGPNRWVLWRYPKSGVGRHVARMRATTASGAVTTGPEGSDQSKGYDGGMQVSFQIVAGDE